MVVAAPKIQPPRPPGEPVPQSYFYHWTRDAALVMDLVNELYKNGDATYAALSRKLQGVPALTGLGEPRFEVSDGRGNTDQWCRPQQDGPALRAYLANGGSLSRVISLYNSTSLGVIKPDLDYTSLNSSVVSGCDLWEENTGLHFFTQMVDRRALKEGAEFALFLGDTAFAKVCSDAAAALDTQVLKYWNAQLKTLTTTVDSTKYLDAAIVLGVIHGYNGDGVYSPADDKVLNTVYQLSLGFIAEYPLNYKNRTDAAGRPYNGVSSAVPNLSSPWYLTTAAVAELYYRAASQYLLVGSLTVTELNRPFFISPRPAGLQIGLGDEYMRRVIVHGDSGVKFGEQFDRENGKANAKGAAELTWSFAAILTASEAREDLRRLLV
ncbi:Six-hairpin glycosidase-like protein [Chytridium lagenaria]|nr:Six-hairpin glycosidase-like protein [Chytridium lagenaria]